MIEPTQIIDEGESGVSIVWSDESETRFSSVQLRRSCPCAGCINEWTGEKMLQDSSVPEDIGITNITIVGRYALNFNFSDGHNTGIYSFNYLRKLAE